MEGKKEENKLYEEKFEWLNSKECKVTHEVKEPIKNKHGKTVGFNTNETSFVGSYEEMEEALHNREFSRDKVLKQHQLEEARLEKLGKKPMKTPEMEGLKRIWWLLELLRIFLRLKIN